MAGKLKVNTDQVAQIASDIENSNKQLNQLLKDSEATIAKLSNTWIGQAYQTANDFYKVFAQNYFQKYYDVINEYVTFLKKNVDEGYFDTENKNISLADAFKDLNTVSAAVATLGNNLNENNFSAPEPNITNIETAPFSTTSPSSYNFGSNPSNNIAFSNTSTPSMLNPVQSLNDDTTGILNSVKNFIVDKLPDITKEKANEEKDYIYPKAKDDKNWKVISGEYGAYEKILKPDSKKIVKKTYDIATEKEIEPDDIEATFDEALKDLKEDGPEIESKVKIFSYEDTKESSKFHLPLNYESAEFNVDVGYSKKSKEFSGEISGSSNGDFEIGLDGILNTSSSLIHGIYSKETDIGDGLKSKEDAEFDILNVETEAKIGVGFSKDGTIGITASEGISGRIVHGTYNKETDIGDDLKSNVDFEADVLKVEAERSIESGLSFEKGGTVGIAASAGASVSIIDANAEYRIVNDKYSSGSYAKGDIAIAKAEVEGEVSATLYKDGKFDPELGAEFRAGAYIVDAEVSAGATIVGVDIGTSAGFKIGAGFEAELGYKDGKLKVEVEAALGIGFSVGLEIDTSGFNVDAAKNVVDAVVGGAESVIDGAKNVINVIEDKARKFFDSIF